MGTVRPLKSQGELLATSETSPALSRAESRRVQTQKRLLLEHEQNLASVAPPGKNNLGFLSRTLVMTSLPYREPDVLKHPNGYARRFQSFSLIIQAGSYTKLESTVRNGKTIQEPVTLSYGFPYGSIPRLILAWLCSEAKIRKSPHIRLADSRAEFMRAIGMTRDTGGVRGTGTLLKDAMQRLFSARIISTTDKEAQKWKSTSFSIAESSDIETFPWWSGKSDGQGSLWSTEVTLSQSFYEDILRSSVPVDMDVLRTLHKSPLSMDIYAFLTWVNAFITNPMELSWEGMAMQFGTNTKALSSFKQRWLEAYQRMSVFYAPPIKVQRNSLIIIPSNPHIEKRKVVTA